LLVVAMPVWSGHLGTPVPSMWNAVMVPRKRLRQTERSKSRLVLHGGRSFFRAPVDPGSSVDRAGQVSRRQPSGRWFSPRAGSPAPGVKRAGDCPR
jgi:hypothetical protein